MVTVSHITHDTHVVDFTGLSTDEKPMMTFGHATLNGSTYYCIDTGELFIFDETHKTWVKQ